MSEKFKTNKIDLVFVGMEMINDHEIHAIHLIMHYNSSIDRMIHFAFEIEEVLHE